MSSRILTAIDIGTSSLKALTVKKGRENDFEILNKIQVPHLGIRRGEVIDAQETGNSLSGLVEKIQRQAKIKPKTCLLTINGPRLFSLSSEGVVSVSRADQKISENDIERALQQAQAVNLPSNKEVLDIFPKEYIVDEEGSVKEPLGLEGIRLKVRALLICAFSPVLESLFAAAAAAGLEVDDVVPSVLASSAACLKEQEKELGVCLLDIGAGTCGLSVFEEGKLIDLAIFPFGSANITNDIAIGLRTKIEIAEGIKKEFGFLRSSGKQKKSKKETRSKNKIELSDLSLAFSKKVLADIIEARVSEMFEEVFKELKKLGKHQLLPSGIVLTGGGSLLRGIGDLARDRLKLPVRLGVPSGIAGLEPDPCFSASAGLLLSLDENKKKREREGTAGGFETKVKKIFKIFLP